MVKYPKEEISYKKLYKKLDLNRDLGIDWPEISENSEVAIIDENQSTEPSERPFTIDEFDEEFCEKNNVETKDFIEIFQRLDKNFVSYVFERLNLIKIKKSKKPCDICGKHLKKDDEAPVLCQGCCIPVHASCYGIFESSKERWLCKSCIFHYEKISCKYCNKNGGILKKTDSNEWGHIVCASLIPKISFCNLNVKDPIDDSEVEVMEGNCNICGKLSKISVKCAYSTCNKLYHAGCAAEQLYCDVGNHLIYCNYHNPLNTTTKNKIKTKCIEEY